MPLMKGRKGSKTRAILSFSYELLFIIFINRFSLCFYYKLYFLSVNSFYKNIFFFKSTKRSEKRSFSFQGSFAFYSRVREWLTPFFPGTVTLDTEPSFPTTISRVAADPSPAERLAMVMTIIQGIVISADTIGYGLAPRKLDGH